MDKVYFFKKMVYFFKKSLSRDLDCTTNIPCRLCTVCKLSFTGIYIM